jgi:hypothetical protein
MIIIEKIVSETKAEYQIERNKTERGTGARGMERNAFHLILWTKVSHYFRKN